MSKTYRPFEPDQMFLLPPSLTDWLPEDHQVYMVRDLIEEIDLEPITSVYEEEERGYPPYHPKMMTALLLYGYANGVFSSRKLARHCQEDVAFRVLTANNQPDFRTIAAFRRRHIKALEHLYLEILRLCTESGMVSFGHVSLDGTKIKANASKHKAMSYGRMKTDIKRLKGEIKHLLSEAERADDRDDRTYGPDSQGDGLPEELRRREQRLAKIRAAKRALEEEARREAAEKGKKGDPPSGPPMATVPLEKDGKTVAEKAQRNFTDPESRIMPYQKTFVQGYNAQTMVDSKHQVIVATALSNSPVDQGQLPYMVRQIAQRPDILTADAAYSQQAKDLLFLHRQKTIDAYIACGREERLRGPDGRLLPGPRGRRPKNSTLRERMKRKLQTKEGRRIYARRKAIAEPPFGQIKHAMGFRQFSMRGLSKCTGEWFLVTAVHNMRRFMAVWRQQGANPLLQY
jgi:transposase